MCTLWPRVDVLYIFVLMCEYNITFFLLWEWIFIYIIILIKSKKWAISHCLGHCSDVIMSMMVSQITGVSIVNSTVYSDVDQGKQQSSASLAFVRGIHHWPVKSPHKGPVTRKMLPFHDVIMNRSWNNMCCMSFYVLIECNAINFNIAINKLDGLSEILMRITHFDVFPISGAIMKNNWDFQ